MNKKLLHQTIRKIKYGRLIFWLEVIVVVIVMFLVMGIAGGTYPY